MLKLLRKQRNSSPARHLVVSVLFAFASLAAMAQQAFTVSGTVKDEQNQPIIGATVVQDGTTRGTATDNQGKFTLSVTSRNASLVVSYIGMKPRTIALAGKSILEVTLQEESVAVDEVVVTALGIKREAKSLGYAVSQVNNEALTAGREQNVMQAIVGKVAGVDISTTTAGPTGSTRILIRGNSQLTGSNLPLYVVDGIPLDNTQIGGADGKWGGSGYDYGDVLSSINPDDIESISVLKGSAAAALYGSMASNGVIMITTKQGIAKKQALGIEVSSNISMVSILSKFDDYQRVYGMGRNGQLPLSEADGRGSSQLAWGAKLDPNLNVQIFNGDWKPYGNVNDNILSFFDTGITAQNSVSFSNGTEKTTFRAAVTDMRNKDIVPKSTFNRTTFTTRGTTRLGKSISLDVSATYSMEDVKNRPALTDNASNIGNALIGIAPNFDHKWLAEGYKDINGSYVDWNSNSYRFNPYWVINEMRNESSRNRLIGSGRFTWDITKWLKFSFRGGMDTYVFRATVEEPPSTPRQVEGAITERVQNVFQSNLEGTLTFTKKIADFDINAFVGANLLRRKAEMFYSTGVKQIFPGLSDINSYERITVEHSLARKEVRSLFGSASIGYKGFVYLDATMRNDVSSTLSPQNRSYIYPSLSGSLIVSNLFQHGDWLSFGKVRTSWAKVGGDTDPYLLDMVYGLKPYKVNGNSLAYADPTNGTVPNIGLKPTSTYSVECGVEAKFFNNRLGIDFAWYQQTTSDQIMALPISETSGYPRAMINAGEIRNRGVEIALNATPVEVRNFSYSTTVTYSSNRNKVISLHPDVSNYEITAARWAGAYIYAMPGEPYGVIVANAIKRNEEGRVIVNSSGLPTFETAGSVLGKGTYDFTLGWTHSFNYKNLNVRFLFDAKFGADMYSMSMMQSYYNGTSKATLEGREEWYRSEQQKVAAGSPANWKATGGYLVDGVKLGEVVDGVQQYIENDTYVSPQAYWQSFQDSSPEPFIRDASFIKFREFAVSYTLPAKWLKKTPLQTVTFTAYGRNLWILYSDVKNIDPESSYYNGNGQGFEYGSLPSRRTFGFGVNVKF